MKKNNINDYEIILENKSPGCGKIIITNNYGDNYSYQWGAMGNRNGITITLEEFILSIDSDYFVKNLISSLGGWEFDNVKTFRNLRKHIRDEILPWYMYPEFQKDMRTIINSFQRNCYDEYFFVGEFSYAFIKQLDFTLIDSKYDQKSYQRDFESITEPWHFIEKCRSKEYKVLTQLHKDLQKTLKNELQLA